MIHTVEQAHAAIAAGELVVVQTDTVLGIIGDGSNEAVVRKLYALKKRDKNKAFVVLLHARTSVEKYVESIPAYAKKFMTAFWPGALTLVFLTNASQAQQPYLSNGTSIGLRIPKAAHLLTLLAQTDKTIISTSANMSNEAPLSSLKEAKNVFGDDVVYWGYEQQISTVDAPSTVVDVTNKDGWQILREGMITKEMLWEVLDRKEE